MLVSRFQKVLAWWKLLQYLLVRSCGLLFVVFETIFKYDLGKWVIIWVWKSVRKWERSTQRQIKLNRKGSRREKNKNGRNRLEIANIRWFLLVLEWENQLIKEIDPQNQLWKNRFFTRSIIRISLHSILGCWDVRF
jgi:hypothetical protein